MLRGITPSSLLAAVQIINNLKLKIMKTNVFELLVSIFENANLDEFEQNGYECISYTRITQSYEDGPEPDYNQEISDFLGEYGYEQVHYSSTGCDERNYSNSETYIYAK